MPATTAQRAYVRAVTGDTNPNDYYVTDDELDAYFDGAGGDLPTTIVYALRQIMGKAVHETDEQGEFGTNRRSQKFLNVRDKLLPYWESVAGTSSAGKVKAGRFSLGIDAKTPSDEWSV